MRAKINHIETCTIVNANQGKSYSPNAAIGRGYKFTPNGVEHDGKIRHYYHITPSTLIRLMIAQLRLLEVSQEKMAERYERVPTV